jgi:hypothetical protein
LPAITFAGDHGNGHDLGSPPGQALAGGAGQLAGGAGIKQLPPQAFQLVEAGGREVSDDIAPWP